MKTDNEIRVTVLGSGTCVPSLKRSSCSLLMETGAHKMVFDVGPGTMRRLLEADVEIFDVDFIFLSHFHPDHTGELVPFLFSNKYADGNRRQKPLTLVGGKGLRNLFSALQRVYGKWIALEAGMMNIIELDNGAFDSYTFEGFLVESAPMAHNPESIAYRITGRGNQSVVYSGDTEFNENLIRLALNADLLICESAFPELLKTEGHLTPSRAGKIAATARVRKLVLTHLYPECDDVDIKKECRQSYSGPIIIAEDLMKVEVPNPGPDKPEMD